MNYYARCAVILLSSISIVSNTFTMDQARKAVEQALWGHGHSLLTGLNDGSISLAVNNTGDRHRAEEGIDSFIKRQNPNDLVTLLKKLDTLGFLKDGISEQSKNEAQKFIVESLTKADNEDAVLDWLNFCELKNIVIVPVTATTAKDYLRQKKESALLRAFTSLQLEFDHVKRLKSAQNLSNKLGASGNDSDDEGYKDFSNLVRTMCTYGSKQRAPQYGNNNNRS